MLNDDLIDVLGIELVDVYQRLEDTVIRDIARRLTKSDRWTETAELQASFMRELGWSPARIRAEVIRRIHADPEYIAFVDQNTIEAKAVQQEAINEAKKELRAMAPEIYETVGNMSWNNDLSVWEKAGKKLNRTSAINQIIENYRKDGVDGILNLTGSMGFSYPTGTVSVRRAYTKALDDALVKTVSGSFSYTTALEDAVRELARSGLRHIDFANKVSRGIDTAVRNALLTSFAQLAGAIMQENIESSGVGYVQVSAHWGARPSHAPWQGKVYTLQQFRDVCGYGEPGNSAHIYSYNCRHQHYPFWPGISEKEEFEPEPGPFTVDGKTYTYYQATQKQRTMERRIRELKREVNAGGDKARLGSLIRQKTQEYNSFSKAVNIRPKLERLRVVGFDKPGMSPSQLFSKSGKIRESTLFSQDDFADFNPLDLTDTEESALRDLFNESHKTETESLIKIVNGKRTEIITSHNENMVAVGTIEPGTTLLHSHTNDTPLSVKDLEHLLNVNVDKVGVVSYNGDAWIAYIGAGDIPGMEEFKATAANISVEVTTEAMLDPINLGASENDLNYNAIREIFFRVCRHYKWTAEGGKLDG